MPEPRARGLPEYLEEKREKLAPAGRYVSANGVPEAVEVLEAVVAVEGRSGVRKIRIRDFLLLSDSGPDFAGYDLGPSSPELFLGALGSCLAHVFLIHAALRSVPLESVDVTVRARMQSASAAFPHPELPVHPYGLEYEATLRAPVGAEVIAELYEVVKAHCPLLSMLSASHDVAGTVVHLDAGRPGEFD